MGEHFVVREPGDDETTDEDFLDRNWLVGEEGEVIPLRDLLREGAKDGEADAEKRAVGNDTAGGEFAVTFVGQF